MLHALAPHTAILAADLNKGIVSKTSWDLVARIGIAWALTFILGFERQLRGAMAGDRTFALIGASTALIGLMTANGSPTILAGAVTGIGFIGGGLCFRQTVDEHDVLHGICTAASIFAAAGIGAACGLGLIKEATAVTVVTLVTLELRHIPVLRTLDARRWMDRFNHDEHMHWLEACEQIILPGQRNKRHDHDHDHSHAGAPAEAVVATPDTADTDAVVLVAQQEAAITTATTDVPVAATPGAKG